MNLVGKTLGNYRIDRLLGEGGMGAVYRAHDLSLQRDVAIKVIHPQLARQSEFRQRLIQEARVMARLDHPGIVKFFTPGREGDLLFLPMELVKGDNLRGLLDTLAQEKKWIPLDEAVLLVRQLCQTIDYAHRNGMLQLDVKPANLMLKPEPTGGLPFRVVLTDLGLAKLLQGSGITQDETSPGTPAYMSPEQALGRAIDRRSDVYSLGVLLYELAVGRLPFPIRTTTEAVRDHSREQMPAPRSIRPDLPENLEKVILKALEKDPADRYYSAAELADVLVGAMNISTEVSEQVTRRNSSLLTIYENSLVRPGDSAYAAKSISPIPDTRIQVLHKEHTAQVYPMTAGTVTIGRGPHNDIRLIEANASYRHLQITWDGSDYYVTDLNSTNGTYLENTKLLPGIPEVWRTNQHLRIGDTWLRLISPTTGTSSLMRSSQSSSSAGRVEVSVSSQQFDVEPGGSVTGTISLLNQSPNVDHFSLSLMGIPGTWISSLPSSVQLMPGEQKDSEFTLHVPRTPQSRAGLRVMTLKVTSQLDPTQFVEVKLTLTVEAHTKFKLSIAHPRLLSKQFTSTFVVQLYATEVRHKAAKMVRASLVVQPSADMKKEIEEHKYDSNVPIKQTVKIKLFSPEITFSEPVNTKLSDTITSVIFVGRPNDNCRPGLQSVGLSISDAETGIEYQSESFQVQITDYVFDHVSRPLLSTMMTIVVGIGSLAMFLLTFLGQIDTTFGVASGTAGAALVSAIHLRFLSLYQKANTTNLS